LEITFFKPKTKKNRMRRKRIDPRRIQKLPHWGNTEGISQHIPSKDNKKSKLEAKHAKIWSSIKREIQEL
jgi:hypothetical protein